jgi:uncharacterized membrane protein
MDYTYLKLIHVFAVVIFLGNIITGVFWMRMAAKTKDLKIISFTMRSIIKADQYFTIPGVIIITIAGIFAAIYGHFPLLRTGWILWSIVLFSISGLVFAYKLAPLQKRIYLFCVNGESDNFDWIAFHTMHRAWDLWGLIAVLAPLAAFAMMILKIPQ